jgi:hypothetical protein
VEEAPAAEGPWRAIAETSLGTYAAPALPAGAARYFRVVSLGAEGELAASAPLAVDAAPRGGGATRLQNLSARGLAGTGGATLIVGFAHRGGAIEVLLRAIGPALGKLGVAGALADPRLTLLRGGAIVAENDNWSDAPGADELAAAMQASGAFALERGALDAATRVTLPGTLEPHTAVVGGGSGVALVEIYDTRVRAGARLTNLSARGAVGAGGEVFILGFEIGGDAPLTVLARAAGPALAAFGVPGALARPAVRLMRDGRELMAGEAWEASANAAELPRAFATTGAFDFARGSADAALLVTLAPGAYSFVIAGRDGAEGVALAELYAWP